MDFTSVVTVLTFSPGDSRQCVTVPILNDSDPEGNEVFVIVVLRTTTTGSSVASASVIIVDGEWLSLGVRMHARWHYLRPSHVLYSTGNKPRILCLLS